MRYLGGKHRIAKKLAARINEIVPDAKAFDDPFCGGLSMSVALSRYGAVHSADLCAPLIALYEAVRNGWDPPTEVSRDTYQAAKALPDTDPLKAFCGFGCSFGGKWFGGYGNPNSCNPRGLAPYAANVLKRDVPRIASFTCSDWLTANPAPIDRVQYLDPPYIGTTGYGATGSFDHELFVDRVLEWARFTHVFVSEYEFPVGVCVYEQALSKKVAGASGGGRVGVEKLFYIQKR